MEPSPNLNKGGPGSQEGREVGYSWRVIDWGFGWLVAATLAVPARLRQRAALIILAVTLAFAELRGPRRAVQWARRLSTDNGRTIDTVALCQALNVPPSDLASLGPFSPPHIPNPRGPQERRACIDNNNTRQNSCCCALFHGMNLPS